MDGAQAWLLDQPASVLVRKSFSVWFHQLGRPCTLTQDPGKLSVRVSDGKIVELLGFDF